jgi:hypothetical protein
MYVRDATRTSQELWKFFRDEIRYLFEVLMIRSIFIVSVITACFSFGAAQSKDRVAQKPNKTGAELMQLERDIGDANVRRDKAFFERIEADEFVFTDSAGGLTTKAEDVASLDKPAGEFKLISYVPDDMKVRVYGNTAVVTGRTTTKLQSKDREVTNRSRFTDVFVKRNGRWQLVAGHSSRLREPPIK